MNVMHPCPNDAFEWIRSGRDEILLRDKPEWKNCVSDLIPGQFEAYAKIPHQIDASYKNIDNPLAEREASILSMARAKICGHLLKTLEKKVED
jgi:hypothetical protein